MQSPPPFPLACGVTALLTLASACGTSQPEPPHTHAPDPATAPATPALAAPAEIDWPPMPDDLAAEVTACVEDYRARLADPFPPRPTDMSAQAWYEGPFQPWIGRYNQTRERCDATFATLDESGPAAQVILATQSALHERMGEQGAPHEEHATMFVMSRYWTLGAACTYQHCASGPLEPWAAFCRRRLSRLPPCPPAEPEPPAAETASGP